MIPPMGMRSESTIEFSVPGVSCEHCERAIVGEVGEVAGVESVAVDLESKTVLVRGHELRDDELRAAIVAAGYDVEARA
jgi:copper chaperone